MTPVNQATHDPSNNHVDDEDDDGDDDNADDNDIIFKAPRCELEVCDPCKSATHDLSYYHQSVMMKMIIIMITNASKQGVNWRHLTCYKSGKPNP